MTGKTHRVGGVLGCLVGYSVLQDKGLLIGNVEPLLQLAVMYPYSIYGSMLSDEDHEWESAPCKDAVSWMIWKVLHFTTPLRRWLQKGKFRRKVYKKIKPVVDVFDSKHRSWQTHSDLTLIFLFLMSMYLLSIAGSSADAIIIVLIAEGIIVGLISHLLLDLITPTGIWSILLTPFKKLLGGKGLAKLYLVPNSKFFATDSDESPWERFIRKSMWVMCFVLIIRLIYVFSPYRIVFDF